MRIGYLRVMYGTPFVPISWWWYALGVAERDRPAPDGAEFRQRRSGRETDEFDGSMS
jgi:hypothetical protein